MAPWRCSFLYIFNGASPELYDKLLTFHLPIRPQLHAHENHLWLLLASYWIANVSSVRHETQSLQRTIQEQSGEIRQLQKQLADLERDKHTEMVKLRLEVSYSIWFFTGLDQLLNAVDSGGNIRNPCFTSTDVCPSECS